MIGETAINFLWRAIQILLKHGVVFFVFVLAAKSMSLTDFGIFSYLMSVIVVLVALGDFGISNATAKYVADESFRDYKQVNSICFNGLLVVLGATCIILLTALIGVFFFLDHDLFVYFLYLIPLIILIPMTSVFDGVYRGMKMFKQLALISMASSLPALVLSVYLVTNFGLIGACISQVILFLSLLVVFFIHYGYLDLNLDTVIAKKIISYATLLGIGALGFFLFSKMSTIVLGHYGFFEVVAIYELLDKFFLIALVPFTILGQVIGPTIGQIKDRDKLVKNLQKFSLLFLLSALVATIVIALSLPLVFQHFFPSYFTEDFFSIFLPILLTYMIYFFSSPLTQAFIMYTGHARIPAYLNIFLVFLNALFIILLLPAFSYIGVLYSVLLTNFVGIVALFVLYYRQIKLYEM